MKFTQILLKQNIGRMIRQIWHTKRDRKIGITRTESYLSSLGIQAIDPSEIVNPKQVFPRYFLLNCTFL